MFFGFGVCSLRRQGSRATSSGGSWVYGDGVGGGGGASGAQGVMSDVDAVFSGVVVLALRVQGPK